MEVIEDMTVDEKKDMLLEFLADLYEIKRSMEDGGCTLDRKIKVIEKRLEVLGVTDLNDIK